MASGTDEAIAYDSLMTHGTPDQWPRVLSMQMRLSSLAGIISMTTGALLYDPDIVNRIVTTFGNQVQLSQQDTMRIPVYLTLILALCAFTTTLRMQEPKRNIPEERHLSPGTLRQAFAVTWKAGIWIFKTPFALTVILFGLLCDHVLRLVITLTSQYFSGNSGYRRRASALSWPLCQCWGSSGPESSRIHGRPIQSRLYRHVYAVCSPCSHASGTYHIHPGFRYYPYGFCHGRTHVHFLLQQ